MNSIFVYISMVVLLIGTGIISALVIEELQGIHKQLRYMNKMHYRWYTHQKGDDSWTTIGEGTNWRHRIGDPPP